MALLVITGWYLVVLDQYRAVLVGTCWYWVSMGLYWLVPGGIGSVLCGTGWYMAVVGQYRTVLVGTDRSLVALMVSV